jgi:hypothetical protein
MYCSVRSSAGCAAHPEILNLRSFGFRVLHNHRGAIAAMDFFTVPTVTFNLLYCFFIISHDRRRSLHFNVTPHPTSSWIVQQLCEAFPSQDIDSLGWTDREFSCLDAILDHKREGYQGERCPGD